MAFATDVLSSPFQHFGQRNRLLALVTKLVTGGRNGVGGDAEPKTLGMAAVDDQGHVAVVG